MLSTLFSSNAMSDFTLDLTPDAEFLNTTSILDIVANVSSDAETFLTEGLTTLETATGELTIAAGVLDGLLTTATGESLSGTFDAPAFLTDLGATLATATGSLALADGIVDATLEIEDQLTTLEDFDLTTFAANGFEFLLTTADASIPIANGAFLINSETAFGPIDGVVDVAGGTFDVDLDTFLGDLAFSLDFGPEDQFPITIPTPMAPIDAVINFDSGNIEVPSFFGQAIAIPLSALSGELTLAEGTSTITLETDFGPISTSFEVDELVGDFVVDTLTGLTVDATLSGGILDLIATSGTETFATAVDLVDLNAQAIETLLQTDGSLTLGSGLVSGSVTVGEDAFAVEQTVEEVAGLLTAPISDLVGLAPAA